MHPHPAEVYAPGPFSISGSGQSEQRAMSRWLSRVSQETAFQNPTKEEDPESFPHFSPLPLEFGISSKGRSQHKDCRKPGDPFIS